MLGARIIKVLKAGNMKVLVFEGPFPVAYNQAVEINGVIFNAVPASCGLDDTIGIKVAEPDRYKDDFFIGANVIAK